MNKNIVTEPLFPFKHFTTAKLCGNMKDVSARTSLFKQLHLNHADLICANQVHGNAVKIVSGKDKGKFVDNCDGLITCEKNISLGIFTADCMPVLMASKDGNAKAAVHAGWRGLAAGILENALKIFKDEFKVSPQDISVYIGPHIRRCCYEVNDDLAKVFDARLKNGRLDLSEAALKILEKNNVKDIFISTRCTMHESDFYSYRRDKTAERQLTVLVC